MREVLRAYQTDDGYFMETKDKKGKVKEQWGKLTDDDLTTIAGKKDQLSGKLQERYGYAKDEADRYVDEWSRTAE